MGVKHGPPSMSKSALLLSPCIAWAGPGALWYDEDKVDKQDTEKRDNGITFHRCIDEYIKHGSCVEPQEVRTLLRHAITYVDEVLRPQCEVLYSEVAVSVNWVTGEAEILHNVTERNYPDRPGWQNGTADVVSLRKDGSLLIGDWKTGGSDGADEQLLSLAYGFNKTIPGRPKVYTSCLSVNEHGVWPHEEDVTGRLEHHADAMRFQWEDIGKKYDPRPGIHCVALYCPHLAYCKAVGDVSKQLAHLAPPEGGQGPLLPPEALMQKMTSDPSSDEEAGMVQALVSAAQRQAKYITECNKKRVRDGGKVVLGQYEWSDGGNGFRWRKA